MKMAASLHRDEYAYSGGASGHGDGDKLDLVAIEGQIDHSKGRQAASAATLSQPASGEMLETSIGRPRRSDVTFPAGLGVDARGRRPYAES